MNKPHDLIIIGSGPAGLTAGIYAARANLHPLIIEGHKPGGQLMGTSWVENWPGEKRILGPDLIKKLHEQAEGQGCSFVSQTVTAVDFSKHPFEIITKRQTLSANSVIIATGASPKYLQVPGEQEYWGRGVTTCAVCDGAFYPNKRVLVVGGGDTAMEDASYMTKFTDKITIVHILDTLTASPAMQERVLNNHKIEIIYNSTLAEIKGDGNHVTQAVIVNKQTDERKTVEAEAVFVAIGLNPNTQIFKGQLELNHAGFIQLAQHTQTSVPGVFAAGDVVDYRYRQAITSAGTGCMAALDVQKYLEEHSF